MRKSLASSFLYSHIRPLLIFIFFALWKHQDLKFIGLERVYTKIKKILDILGKRQLID